MANEETAKTAPEQDTTESTTEELQDPVEITEGDEQPEMPRETRVLHKLYACMHLLHHRKRSRSAHGQGRLLAILVRTGKVSQRDLQDMTGIRSASLSELLKKLEANGFIMREQNEEDRRSVDISLTEAGSAEAERMRAERDADDDLFSALSEDELERLDTLLSKLLKSWDPEGEFSPRNPDCRGRRGGHHHGRSRQGRGHGHDGCERHGHGPEGFGPEGCERHEGDRAGHGYERGRRGRGFEAEG